MKRDICWAQGVIDSAGSVFVKGSGKVYIVVQSDKGVVLVLREVGIVREEGRSWTYVIKEQEEVLSEIEGGLKSATRLRELYKEKGWVYERGIWDGTIANEKMEPTKEMVDEVRESHPYFVGFWEGNGTLHLMRLADRYSLAFRMRQSNGCLLKVFSKLYNINEVRSTKDQVYDWETYGVEKVKAMVEVLKKDVRGSKKELLRVL